MADQDRNGGSSTGMHRRRSALVVATASLALVAALGLPAAGSPTPTDTPPAPTATPTESTTAPVVPDPPVPAPDPPAPSAEPVPAPSPSSTDDSAVAPVPTRYLSDAQAAAIRTELEESDQAVVEAQLALAETDAEFFAVTALLEEANDELGRATAADAKAQQDLSAAEQAEAKVGRELAGIQDRMSSSQEALGQVARSAYQSGPYSSMSVALEAETPNEFASRLIGVETVVRAENAALAQLSVARADLLDSQQRYRAVRERLSRERAAAASTLAKRQSAQTTAATTQATLDDVRGRRSTAVAAAEQARAADIAKHADYLAASGEVGRAILASVAARAGAAAGSVAATGAWVKPGTGAMTSAFGQRYHPILHYVKLHTGVDIGVGDGWVYAADAGVVVEAGPNRAYGNMTVIDHGTQAGRGVSTLYAHQSSMLVRPGDTVVKGQRIGRIGATGYATGPHLHFEIRLDGEPADPWPAIQGAPAPA